MMKLVAPDTFMYLHFLPVAQRSCELKYEVHGTSNYSQSSVVVQDIFPNTVL